MKSKLTLKRTVMLLLSLVLCLSAIIFIGCGNDNQGDQSAQGKVYNITYDLDGGIDGGNPATYDNAQDLKLIMPIRPGYDFAGWTGTGLAEATKTVTVAKGTEGDLSYKANWVENEVISQFEIAIDETTASTDMFGDIPFEIDSNSSDTLMKVFSGASEAAIIINSESTFENHVSVNASTELVTQKLQAYFEKHKQIVKLVRDINLEYDDTKYDFYIYMGISDCEPVEEFVASMNYAQYGIAVEENSISFICWTEDAAVEAIKILREIFKHIGAGGSYSDFVGGRYVGTVEGTVGDKVPHLEGLDGGTDVGEGSYQLYSIDSTMDIYNDYLKKLEAAGFTLHTTNVMNKTHCATYYNEDTVVNVVFAGGDPNGVLGVNTDRSLRVVVDPLSNTALPSTEKPADADANVTVTSVTQMYPQNLCIVFQLSNGHFVIFDAGNNGTQKALSDFLRKMAPDGKPVVEAWFFSHFHQDHIGGFVDYMGISSLTRYITVKNVIYNFPSYRTWRTAYKSSTDMSNMKLFYDKRKPAMEEKGTTFYQARTGQKYYFGNAEIDVLWTFEDITPFNIFGDSTNRTDIGIRVTVEGQTFVLTGDSTEEQFRVATARYGDYLKSDFLQLAHHGSGNGLGMHNLYTTVDATVVFHPRMHRLDEDTYGIGTNEKLALQKAELVIRSGNYGTATLILPFKVGDKIESTKTPIDESHTYME